MASAKLVSDRAVNGVPLSSMMPGDFAITLNEGGSGRWPIGTILYRPPTGNAVVCFETETSCGINAYENLRVRILDDGEKVEIII